MALMNLMRPQLLKTTDFGEIFDIIENYPKKIIDIKILVQNSDILKFKVKNRYINLWR